MLFPNLFGIMLGCVVSDPTIKSKEAILEFIERMKDLDKQERLDLLSNVLESDDVQMNYEIRRMLEEMRMIFNSTSDESVVRMRLDRIVERFRESERNYRIITDIKKYKNLYIFLLAHPDNQSTAIIEILSRMNYLDKMTRDVSFIMPGYKKAKDGDKVVNKKDELMPLSFDENAFIEITQDLEESSNGAFHYVDESELLIIGQKDNGEYDFSTMCRINLDELRNQKGIDPIKFIIDLSNRFRQEQKNCIDANEFVNQTITHFKKGADIYRFFVAGAKKMKKERSLLREELSKLQNKVNKDIRVLTFEDFETELKGKPNAQQKEYNSFITNEADVVVFVFGSKAGYITEEEFNVAYKSLCKSQRPKIYVYVKKRLFSFFPDERLKSIREKVFAKDGEYYVEYDNDEDLRYKISNDMRDYFDGLKVISPKQIN